MTLARIPEEEPGLQDIAAPQGFILEVPHHLGCGGIGAGLCIQLQVGLSLMGPVHCWRPHGVGGLVWAHGLRAALVGCA